jgi:hypothetical protein
MKGDFARVSYDPPKHYRRVLQQQGRVLLEADWNEQSAITLHLLGALAADLVGPCWAAGASAFLINTTDANGNQLPKAGQWQLSPGRFYVDGILCENDAAGALASQPSSPTPDDQADGTSAFNTVVGAFVIWIDVWERHLSWVEAPSSNDPALHGLNTASRGQVVWQLRPWSEAAVKAQLGSIGQALQTQRQVPDLPAQVAAELDQIIKGLEALMASLDKIFAALYGGSVENRQSASCDEIRAILELRARLVCPQLRARLQPAESSEDPCVIAADARYRGFENQLYRVEIHNPGLPSTESETNTTFKWSRENGSVIFPIVDCGSPSSPVNGVASLLVQLQTPGPDERLGLSTGDWVELIDDQYTLAQKAAPLLQLSAVNITESSVTLAVPAGVTPYLPSTDPLQHPLLRRWDQRSDVDSDGVVPLVEGQWTDLEAGIQIRFEPGAVYATGDYWVIPARVEIGDILWPQDDGATPGDPKPSAVRAAGLHHFAVLGGVDPNLGYHECCCRFVPPCAAKAGATIAGRLGGGGDLLALRSATSAASSAKKTTTRPRAKAKR